MCCLLVLLLFASGHRCWEYNPDLDAIFPMYERRSSLARYIENFLDSINRITSITNVTVSSVSYCRTRGPSAYPFLIVHLSYREIGGRPIMLKLQGFDGPPTEGDAYYNPEEHATVTVAYVGESIRRLAGARRYDVCHTLDFGGNWVGIADLLVVAELSAERDRTRQGIPQPLFGAGSAL
ncbi:hypothetical protein B0H13DRAFT_1883894 [Mycena leptocephala]|nr:hypothetical protein B0H13DRAFT_1883894 [Mycena leptocephala]